MQNPVAIGTNSEQGIVNDEVRYFYIDIPCSLFDIPCKIWACPSRQRITPSLFRSGYPFQQPAHLPCRFPLLSLTHVKFSAFSLLRDSLFYVRPDSYRDSAFIPLR